MSAPQLLDPATFASLTSSLEEETRVSESISQTVRKLNDAVGTVQGLLSRVHSTPRSEYTELLQQVEAGIATQISVVGELSVLASSHPYYKYNHRWNRSMQESISTVLLCAWLGGLGRVTGCAPGSLGRLLTLEEIGALYGVPTNLTTVDAFHVTIEEYLLGLADLSSVLARLAVNATTMGDYEISLVVTKFVRGLFDGFQLLNLKNDIVRRKVDGIKYDVKQVESVTYDLSIRGLVKLNPERKEAA